MDAYSSQSSPIQKLPVESLTEIFILSSGKNELTEEEERVPANTLTLVSRKWCDIAHHTPSLWSSIDIELDCCWGNDVRTQRWHRLLEVLVRRSQAAPLFLYIENIDYRFDQGSNIVSRILDPLIRHCQRWERLELQVHESLLRQSIFSPIRSSLTSLRSLTVENSFSKGQQVTLFEECPVLEQFGCDMGVIDKFLLPWAQLTSITYKMPTPDALVRALFRCQALTALHLENLYGSSAIFGAPKGRVLTQITSLWLVGGTSNPYITYWLDMLKTPRLSLLEIEGFNAPGSGFGHDLNMELIIPHIMIFLRISSCSIRKLSFKYLPFTDAQLISVLKLTPTVETLTIYEVEAAHRLPQDGLRNNIVTRTFLEHLRYCNGASPDCDSIESNPPSSTTNPSSSSLLLQLASLELRVFVEELDDKWCNALAEAVMSRQIPHSDDTAKDANGSVADCACLRSLRLSTMDHKPFPRAGAFGRLVLLADKEDRFELVLD